MHTTSYDDGIYFIHNGDYSGDVEIGMPSEKADFELHHIDNTTHIKIPFKALEYLVSSKVSSTLADQLGDAEDFQGILEVFGFRDKKLDCSRLQFIQALAALDNPDNMARRSVTLQDIIDSARKLI